MKHHRKYLGSVAVTVLACALLSGSAQAVPAPSLVTPESPDPPNPAISQVQASGSTAPEPVFLAMVVGGKPALRGPASELSVVRRVSQDGTQMESDVSVSDNAGAKRSKAKYVVSGLVLAAMAVPIALHHSGDASAQAVTVQTNPAPTAEESGVLDDAPAEGGGEGGVGDTPDSGGSSDYETSEEGGSLGGDAEPSGLPEPGTVPLVGAGILALYALRRRNW
jgi:hypothetical protein